MTAWPRIVVLWSDGVLIGLAFALLAYAWHVRGTPARRELWRRALRNPATLCAGVVLGLFLLVALADSLHFRRALPQADGRTVHAAQVESVLDVVLSTLVEAREVSYSAPLASRFHAKGVDGTPGHGRLRHGGAHLRDDTTQRWPDIALRSALGAAAGGLAAALLVAGLTALGAARARERLGPRLRRLVRGETVLPWRAAALTVIAIGIVAGAVSALATHYHVLGTDRTGNDVLLQALKSIRTAFVIGTLSTVATLPLAVGLGILAGYLGGWVDDLVQYLYTVLSSIPNVLLIAACVLMMQVFIDTHPDLFETGAERADVRLFLLCVILGLTGWAGLCRLVRAETLKLRELDYVQAATAFGVGPWRIMARHVFPNVVHLVIITTVLDFSALVLYEAVLSYVGVGVDPSMNSFGGMINLARSEMSRDPVVWWSFTAAFVFMVALVLAANLFADGVRDAFDPRAAVYRARRRPIEREAA